jgi:DNA replication protein DnaC
MNALNYEKLHDGLLKLDMCHLETRIDGLLEDESAKNKTFPEMLLSLLEEEINFRENRAIKMRIKLARLPFQKTIVDFDFAFQGELDKERVLNLFSMKFLKENGNVIFIGPPGVGKTHLAVSLGIAACQNGFTCYFITFQELIDILKRSHEQGRLKKKLQTLSKPHMLIIDELGYLPLKMEEANLFFQLVSSRYRKGSIILTSNRSYSEWTELFPVESIATAILDRLLESSSTIKISGDSYRLKLKKKLGLFNN